MPHLCCSGGIPPVAQPAPGVQSISGLEQGERDGTARDPDTGQLRDIQHHRFALMAPNVPTIAPGVPRDVGAPSARIDEVRPFDGAVGWAGTHIAFEPGASMPKGSQNPLTGAGPNTWRAAPMPWDTNLYVGVTPRDEG
jgi:hypothetical protein